MPISNCLPQENYAVVETVSNECSENRAKTYTLLNNRSRFSNSEYIDGYGKSTIQTLKEQKWFNDYLEYYSVATKISLLYKEEFRKFDGNVFAENFAKVGALLNNEYDIITNDFDKDEDCLSIIGINKTEKMFFNFFIEDGEVSSQVNIFAQNNTISYEGNTEDCLQFIQKRENPYVSV